MLLAFRTLEPINDDSLSRQMINDTMHISNCYALVSLLLRIAEKLFPPSHSSFSLLFPHTNRFIHAWQ
jgi:hypothetical protein